MSLRIIRILTGIGLAIMLFLIWPIILMFAATEKVINSPRMSDFALIFIIFMSIQVVWTWFICIFLPGWFLA